MKIIFLASIYGKQQFVENYQTIIQEVETHGHTVQADHVMNNTAEVMAEWSEDQDFKFHKTLIDKIKATDVVFAEVSAASTSVGYLIAAALQAGKPVVVFYSGAQEPHLFKALEKLSDKFQVVRYKDVAELKKEIPFVLDFVSSIQDVRFNFFISADHASYLDWIARNRKIPRSVYLRHLIEDDMVDQKEYWQ